MDVPSPCVNICTLGPGEVCTGCGRHIDEIAVWGSATAAEKQRIVAAARDRLARLPSSTVEQRQARA